MKGRLVWLFGGAVLFCLVISQALAGRAQQQPVPRKPEPLKPARAAVQDKTPAAVDLIWGFKIPMRDGVSLNGTVYKPAGQKDPLPVIFTLTPYVSDSYHNRAYYFAQHRYVFVLVDVRGRGNSEVRTLRPGAA
jgi:predicted acyl esterase